MELARALEKDGFALSRARRSHRIYRDPETRQRVTLPYRTARIMTPGTLANILRQAGVDREDLAKLLGL